MTPTVTPIEVSDAPAALRFIRESRDRTPDGHSPPEGWLTWLRRASALAGIEIPLGWKLSLDGRIVGVHFVTPFRNIDQQGRAFHDLVSHNYYVDQSFRGLPALALFQRFLSFKKQFRLKATTANATSGTLWRHFRAFPVIGSEIERFETKLAMPLLAEAVYRTVPGLATTLPGPRPHDHETLSARVEGAVEGLAGLVATSGADAIAVAASLAVSMPRPSLEITSDFLGWVLANPCLPHQLLILRRGGRSTVVVLAGVARGRRRQIAGISIRAIWGEDVAIDGEAVRLVHRACARAADVVTYGCDVSHVPVPARASRRRLDGARRWIIATSDTPAVDCWSGLDGL